MMFRVNLTDEAKALINEQVRFIAVEKLEPQNAEEWLTRVDDAIASLKHLPERCSFAPENECTSATVHMLPVDSHLILFTVDKEAKVVNILSFRAGRQSPRQSLGE